MRLSMLRGFAAAVVAVGSLFVGGSGPGFDFYFNFYSDFDSRFGLDSGSQAVAEDWGAKESFAVVDPVVRSPLSEVVSLSGEWDFLFDAAPFRLSVGEGVWASGYDWSKARKIQVPGCWEAQGVGEPGHCKTWDAVWDCGDWELEHVATGRAYYRKTVDVPESWAGKRVWLKVGGVRSEAYFWVDGKRAAFVDAYCGARKFDITPFLKPGETAEIVAQVRNDVPSRVGLLAVNHLFGGFYRDVELEATPTVFVDDVWVRGDVKTGSANVRVYVKSIDKNGNAVPTFLDELYPAEREARDAWDAANASSGSQAGIEKIAGAGSVEISIKTLDGKVVGKTTTQGFSRRVDGRALPVEATIPIENCELWTPEKPTLYLADVVVKDQKGNALHGWTERFGVRELKVVGRQFFLNGKPYFFRGCGDHNYDQINLFEPADRDRFREHMSIYKAAGFNYARFHTHCPFPEYFETADELGFLLQPEAPYYHDVTTEGFDFNPKREMFELFRTNRRYVSFATYSFGNEGFLGDKIGRDLYGWVKKFDPDRLAIHQDGGKNLPENSDFTNSGVAKPGSIINPWKVGDYDDVDRPFVAHEYLNLAIKMDPRLESRFTGIRTAPVSVARWEKGLADVGLNADWGAACIAAAEKLQGIYQKRGLESARLDPACDGYLFWSIVDASIPQGNCVAAQGYLNPFWEPRPNGLAPRDFYRFNGPTALLLTTDLSAPILTAGQKFAADFRISHYDAETIPAGTLDWRFVVKNADKDAEPQVLASGAEEIAEIAPGTAGILTSREIEIPADVAKPEALELVVSIRGTTIENRWNYWVFPKRERKSLAGFAVSDAWFERFSELYDDVEPISASTPDDGKIWVVSPDESAFADAIAAGRKVFAISQAASAPNVSLGWWSLGTQVGTTFAKSPAFGDFPNDASMDELWFRLIRVGAPDLKSKPLFGAFDPLALGEARDWYYLYLGQTQVGASKILGSFAIDLTQDAPEATALLDRLLEYVASPNFAPTAKASSNEFDAAFVPEGVVWGFGGADAKTERYVGPSLYDAAATMFACRQKSGSSATWTSRELPATVAENPDGSTTFMFVGGLGYWSQPKTDGFEFCVDGASAVRFDLPEASETPEGTVLERASEDGATTLKFEVQKRVEPGPDFFGVFTLTVPNAKLASDPKRATFTVRALGDGSLRWFAVNAYRGLLKK